MAVTGLVLVGCFSGGCATITNGLSQKVHVSTAPVGAKVYAEGTLLCTTPGEVTLRRSQDYRLHITKEGFEDVDYPMTRKSSGAIAGNFWIGGIFGLAVDLMTGADNKFVPESVDAHMVPLPARTADYQGPHGAAARREDESSASERANPSKNRAG